MDIQNTLSQGKKFDAVILAVAHDKFKGLDIDSLLHSNHVLYDVKGMISGQVDGRL